MWEVTRENKPEFCSLAFMRLQRLLLFVLFSLACSGLRAQADFGSRLSEAALALTEEDVVYDPAYYSMAYPGGDVPEGRGVCSDVVIRAYRALGIDLQKEVHEDMKAHFELYPKIWGLSRPDPNIDHRRVPNLMMFFERHGQVKAMTNDPSDYHPGDIVCWNLGGAVTHIGFVVNVESERWNGLQIVHNIGAGQVVEDCLFEYRIIGHYSYEKE